MKDKNRGPSVWTIIGMIVLLVAAYWVHQHWPMVLRVLHLAALVVVAALLGLFAYAGLRVLLAHPDKRRNFVMLWRARWRWRWLCRAAGLVHMDRHSGRLDPERPPRVMYPLARFRADRYGIVISVTTVPKVGRLEFEKSAQHLADAMRCVRVSVSQRAPGHLVVRGVRKDPLARFTTMEDAPEGTYSDPHPFAPYVGRDEWAAERYLDLSGVTGITVAGLPGMGKTSLVLSLLWQLAGSGAVQFVFVDGKGGGDYRDWQERSWMYAGDDLGDAVRTFGVVEALMRARLAKVEAGILPRNGWHRGPTPKCPLIVTVVDECHSYFDSTAVKSGTIEDGQVKACRGSVGQLVKKGRSVLFVTIIITQKQTSDAVPTAIRDNCRYGFSFGVKTKDAAVAALGEAIREYPSYCPTTLRDPSMVGVCTASMQTGQDPFVRLRVPEVSERAAAERARDTGYLREDPMRLLAAAEPAA